MIGTLLSLAIATFFYLNPIPANSDHAPILGGTFLLIGTLFILTQVWINVFAWRPLQKAEQNLTPRISEIFQEDIHLRFANLFLLSFLLVTYLLSVDLLLIHSLDITLLLIVWTILLGISVDLIVHLFHRVMSYLNPFQVVNMVTKKAGSAIRNAEELELSQWIDTLSEISMKAIERNSNSLAIHAINQFNEIMGQYLQSEKVITHHKEEEQEELHTSDPISYMLFFLFQRIEMINDLAIEQRIEPICSHIQKTLGRITIHAAKCDITLATYPIHYMGKFARLAQEHEMKEIANNTLITLLEVGKMIVREIDVQYLEIKETFQSLIFYMHDIVEETFRRDKESNIKLLTQPFRDLKMLFKEEKVASHQDTPVIDRMIDSVIEEFVALESVLSTMPPLPSEERESQP